MNKKELIKLLKTMEAKEPTVKVTKPEDVVPKLLKYANKKVEYFIVVTLGAANEIIKVHEITKGILNKTIVHPREVFRPAIIDSAKSIILAHNHPSGSLTASVEDKDITKRLNKAGEILGIDVLDHIIISKNGFKSLLDEM